MTNSWLFIYIYIYTCIICISFPGYCEQWIRKIILTTHIGNGIIVILLHLFIFILGVLSSSTCHYCMSYKEPFWEVSSKKNIIIIYTVISATFMFIFVVNSCIQSLKVTSTYGRYYHLWATYGRQTNQNIHNPAFISKYPCRVYTHEMLSQMFFLLDSTDASST